MPADFIVSAYADAMKWIVKYTLKNKGISITNVKNKVPYPEVSGYFIPSLINWGQRKLAYQYANWLISIQGQDGYWCEPSGVYPYVFDTGQVLKGLAVVKDYLPDAKEAFSNGVAWLESRISCDGRIVSPNLDAWNGVVPEAVHLYAIPLNQRHLFERAVEYYLRHEESINFSCLSHFHAYIIEACVDLGYLSIAKNSMKLIQQSYLGGNAKIPAYPNTRWTCSTGLFQYAVIWYKLGEKELADRVFEYGVSLQNKSGGFYGSYGWGANYFPKEEISWAIKYFLDALHLKLKAEFESCWHLFLDEIDCDDGRLKIILDNFSSSMSKVIDLGCGKGRYLKHLIPISGNAELYGLDLSMKTLSKLDLPITLSEGSVLNIGFSDEYFDYAFCIETLEHAIDIPSAICEMCRVIKPGGRLVIIDKNKFSKRKLKLLPWEQWFDASEVTGYLEVCGMTVNVYHDVPYEHSDGSDSLFIAWVAVKNEC